jgi:hypothetical protein
MILSAHQPAFMPWPGLLAKMNQADAFVILDDVQFERNSYINRNLIAIAGKPHWVTVPVRMAGHTQKTIRQMEVDESTDWRRKMWETFRHNYNKAPYWEENANGTRQYIESVEGSLSTVTRWNTYYPGLVKTSIIRQSMLGITGEKQELIIKLCKNCGADKFLFGRNGRDYVNEEYFMDNGIMPMYQEYQYPVYQQFGEEFLPGLSIIDMLFHCGHDRTREMIEGGSN